MYSPSEISAISRLFSAAVFKEMIFGGKSAIFARLMKELGYLYHLKSFNIVSDVFEVAFKDLKTSNCRSEYIYKAALAHKILLGTHNLKTASMLHEFRVDNCKADVAILNGTATVYEIKSERDSLSKLGKQIEAYKKFFAKVYVIAGEHHIDNIKSIVCNEVGILKLSNRYQISTVHNAKDCPERISPLTIFESIRIYEAKQILNLNDIYFPDVPNTEVHSLLKEKFLKLAPSIAHASMVEVLKKTRTLAPLSEIIGSIPKSLQSFALTNNIRIVDHSRLINALNTPFNNALAWA